MQVILPANKKAKELLLEPQLVRLNIALQKHNYGLHNVYLVLSFSKKHENIGALLIMKLFVDI